VLAPPGLPRNRYLGLFPRDVRLSLTHHLVQMLRMSGAVPPLPLYAFMASKVKTDCKMTCYVGCAVRLSIETITYKLDFCLTVHHQLGKVIQMNQLDATMIY